MLNFIRTASAMLTFVLVGLFTLTSASAQQAQSVALTAPNDGVAALAGKTIAGIEFRVNVDGNEYGGRFDLAIDTNGKGAEAVNFQEIPGTYRGSDPTGSVSDWSVTKNADGTFLVRFESATDYEHIWVVTLDGKLISGKATGYTNGAYYQAVLTSG